MKAENKLSRTNKPGAKETYEAPVIEIVEVKVEHGFQATSDTLSGNPNDEDSEGTF